MNELEPSMYKEAIPAVMDMLFALWRVDMSDTSGFGWFNSNGEAGYQSWTDHLQRIGDEEPEDFYGCWHRLFDETFLDRRLFEHYLERMSSLLSRMPTIRGLVHGGFGYGNVLVDKGSVTALLDWCDARVGDPVFDIAYMDFWPSGHDLLTAYESSCSAAGLPLPAFADRVLCYKYYDGLDALRFFAKTDNRAAYDSTAEILAHLESNGRV